MLTRVFAHIFFQFKNDSICINWTKSLPGRPPARKNPVGSCAAGRIRARAGTSTSQDRTLGGEIIPLVST